MILGNICTRNCSFCGVTKGVPQEPDPGEIQNVCRAVELLGLKHVVLTSPTRDDLPDGGASFFAQAVRKLKESQGLTVEPLIPDFSGKRESIRKVVEAAPDIIGHNIETVRRLYPARNGFRDPDLPGCADYDRSIGVLGAIRRLDSGVRIKSGIMLGFGETGSEVLSLMKDIYDSGCRYLSIGQYLAPGKENQSVSEYISPEKFEEYRQRALSIGFIHVESEPYVRTSYNADKYLKCGTGKSML